MKNILTICIAGLGMAFVAGCQVPSHSNAPRFQARPTGIFSNSAAGLALGQKLDPKLLQPAVELFTLGPGDQIQVEILGRPTSRTDLTVGPDGKIYFDLLPAVDVWGLTVAQTKKLLTDEFDKYQSGTQVSVTLRSVGSKHIWMMGSIAHPGVYPTTSPLTLLEAMSLAGGVSRSMGQSTTVDLADLKHAFVIRGGSHLPVDFLKLLEYGDMSQNIYLQPDDFVYVPSGAAREVFLFGAVHTPRTLPLADHPTLVSAIAAGGGPLHEAYVSQVAIVRGSLSSPEIAIVDYEDIITGRTGDVELQPQDIVFVPYSPYRILTRYFDAILSTFVNTVAANEGVNAFGAGRVGVSVPVGN